MKNRISPTRIGNESGTTIIECALVAAVVSLAAVTMISATGNSLSSLFNAVRAEVVDVVHG
jgi:Flp pilus assembly pilin Flp